MDTSIRISHKEIRMPRFPDILLYAAQNSHTELVDQVTLMNRMGYLPSKPQ